MNIVKTKAYLDTLCRTFLFREVDSASMIVFRVCFGIVLLFHSLEYLLGNQIEEMWSGMYFTWSGFEWVRPFPAAIMHLIFKAMFCCSLMIAVGLFYRLACVLSLVSCVYIFLLERISYVNHDYFLCLLCFLMIFVPANRNWSIDAWMKGKPPTLTIPGWSLWLIRLQVGIPYFFGGVAKLFERDWMTGKVTASLIEQVNGAELLGEFGLNIAREFSWVMTYGGLIFDLVAVPLLIWKPSRPYLLAIAVAFNVTNAFFFRIEIFPWLMLAGTMLYLEPDWPRELLRWVRGGNVPKTKRNSELTELSRKERFIFGAFSLWFAIQLLIPLQYFFCTGNPCWTLNGQFFCWRMMLHTKVSDVVVFATNSRTGQTTHLPLSEYLSVKQYLFVRHDPHLIRQLAKSISSRLNSPHESDHIIVRVISKSSMNGNTPQWLILPTIDLGVEPDGSWNSPWIVPYGDITDYGIPDGLVPFFKK